MHVAFIRNVAVAALVVMVALAGCGAGQTTSSSSASVASAASGGRTSIALPATSPAGSTSATEQPLAPEQNPVGDIPDNQAFVAYSASPGGYTLEVPEGWARSVNGTDVQFVSKFDGLSVNVVPVSAAPTASANDPAVAALVQAGRAVTVQNVKTVTLPAGKAVLVTSTANSAPDPVTNKQVRLEQNTYIFFNNGKEAMLNLWAPQGADNVDQWNHIAQSFRWQ